MNYSTLLQKIAFLLLILVQTKADTERCSNIGFLPRSLVPQYANDLQDSQKERDQQFLDVHTFNHFFTFQIDHDVNLVNEGVEMVIPP